MIDKYTNFFIFDFETGGLDPKKHAACEIACIMMDGVSLQITDTYESLIAPYDDKLTYETQALKANGLTMEIINQGDKVQNVVQCITDFIKKNTPCKQAKYLPILVGQNVGFDIGFLQQIFSYSKCDLSTLIKGYKGFDNVFYPLPFDTTPLTFMAYNHDNTLQNHKLQTICEKLGVTLNDAHRAMTDTVATYEVFKIYCKRLREESSTVSKTLLQEIHPHRKNFQI